jgi:tetratricopeptide (TPR) repeat protein
MMSVAARFCFLLLVLGMWQSPGDATYRRLVDAYRGGQGPDDTAIQWLTGNSAELDALARTWAPDDLVAAVLLHTDVAVHLLKIDRRPEARTEIDRAAQLLGTVLAAEPGRLEFARRWTAVVAGLLHAYGGPDIAATLEARMAESLAETKERIAARLAFEKGVGLEIQAAVAGPLSGPAPRRTAVVPAAALSALGRAAQQYDAALAADPDYPEAALHLGRIRLLEGRDTEAERWLRLATVARAPAVRYLGWMFLGAAAERQGHYADAEAAYRSALAAFRWGQAAPLALSHLLMRVGREAESRDAIAGHVSANRGREIEPLWTYLADPAADLGPTLSQLRAEVWR